MVCLLSCSFLSACVVAYGPLHAAAQAYPESAYFDNLAKELLGWHYEHFKSGFAWPGQGHCQITADSHVREDDQARRLEATFQNRTFFIPCVKFPTERWKWVTMNRTLIDVVEPCGTINLPPEGMTFHTILGDRYVPGDVYGLHAADTAFSDKMFYVVVVIAVFYVLHSCCGSAQSRAQQKAQMQAMKDGTQPPSSPDPTLSPEQAAADAQAKMDPSSPTFICTGNIYRICCIMNPGVVGYSAWRGYCLKAAFCAYMQFYLPYNILEHSLTKWAYNGVKSPFYYLANLTSFITQFLALANVVALFGAKCANSIQTDAGAIWYIATHEVPPPPPPPPPAPGSDTADPTKPAGGDGGGSGGGWFFGGGGDDANQPGSGSGTAAPLLDNAKADLKGDVENAQNYDDVKNAAVGQLEAAGKAAATQAVGKLAYTVDHLKPPDWVLALNTVVWCSLNLILTCFTSVMLQICIFMKIATFTGDVMNVSLVATALYFVFGLDEKIMESDPNLKTQFNRLVADHTHQVNVDKFSFINKVASGAILFIKWMTPLGLLMIFTVSWRQVAFIPLYQLPMVIGGDPFAPWVPWP